MILKYPDPAPAQAQIILNRTVQFALETLRPKAHMNKTKRFSFKVTTMKPLLPLALILSVLSAPAFAGGFGSIFLPTLTWPDDATTTLGTKATKP
jgi:predicted S18 family serine protease